MRRLVALMALVWAFMSSRPTGAGEAQRFSVKKAGESTFYLVESASDLIGSTNAPAWARLRSPRWGTNEFQSSSRIVLEVPAPESVSGLLRGRPLILDKTIATGLFILQAPDALTALEQAEQLSTNADVVACYPVMRHPKRLASVGNYAPAPNDPFFPQQFQLENRAASGAPLSNGADINARGAWSVTHGEGIVLAIVDAGAQYTHPDLAGNNLSGLNLDFSTVINGNYATGSTNALPTSSADAHATEVAGLASAVGNNGIGLSGVAPGAMFTSWKIFSGGGFNIDSEQEMAMYEYQSNVVAVQNHSWTDANELEQPLDALENAGIQTAVTRGRGGKGTILVRAAGNDRANGYYAHPDGNDANDDPYASDTREIAVAAVGADGRAASYSSPGACILVAVPGGDLAVSGTSWGWPWQINPPALFTTRFTTNAYADANDPGYYASGPWQAGQLGNGGFAGTSAATPVMSGIAALILSANTKLTYRDVQQVIAVSSRHYDLADPAVQTNGAGLRVSYNVGYGVPDAGLAVRLAKMWTNRPLAISVTNTVGAPRAAIPQDGLRLVISNTPAALQSIHGTPSYGVQADHATPFVAMVDAGDVKGSIQQNLAGKAVLIHPDTTFPVAYPPYQQILDVVRAGAAFAVIYRSYDNPTELRPQYLLSKTDFIPIPAMLITHADGTNLAAYLQAQGNIPVRGQMITLATNITINVTNTLSCEHVRLTIRTDCTNRSGMRIVLTSPMGTQSVMQHLNQDTSPGPVNWTYSSTEHFFESSAGAWRVTFSYEQPGGGGNVTFVSLAIDGIAIVDTDHDGLDDRWEMQWFGNLAQGAKDSPAGDGWPNSVKQILGVNPKVSLFPFNVDLSLWNSQWARLAWPGVSSDSYQILTLGGGAPVGAQGNFPETESFIPYSAPVGIYSIKRQ